VLFPEPIVLKLTQTVLQVVEAIGPNRFTAICSDNTGNTKNARRDVVKKYPTILNLADVCHHLANTAKDISNLPEFTKVGPHHRQHTCSR